MSQTTTITSYVNGNCRVTLMADGTKVRSWEGAAAPVFPESIDLKITNYCDADCKYCHEASNTNGKHAKLANIHRILKTLPPGVEIAIGGGNPMSFPKLEKLLVWIKERGLIANLTINDWHLEFNRQRLFEWSRRGLFHGLGISANVYLLVQSGIVEQLLQPENAVIHVILGVNDVADARRTARRGYKLLILGFKQYGRASKSPAPTQRTLQEWRYWLPAMAAKTTISFDNLAVEQLQLSKLLPADAFNRFYMGDDGAFTMYVDAVRMQYAISSVSPRHALTTDVVDAFQELQEKKHDRNSLPVLG